MPVIPLLRHLALSAAFGLAALPAAADINAGAFLAGRQAANDHDFAAASQYFTRALVRDPGNVSLMENTITAFLGLGDVERAATLARQVLQTGAKSQTASLVLLGLGARDGDWDALLADLEAGQSVGPLFDGLLRAWIHVGLGDMDEALRTFDDVSKSQGVKAFGLYHKALALAASGDYAAAETILSNPADGGLRLTRRGIVAQVQILSQLGRNDDALKLIADTFGSASDRALDLLADRLRAGEKLAFDITPDAGAGVAEIYFSVATALTGEANDGYTLLYTRMAEALRPDHIEAVLLSAGMLEQLGRHELAIAAYARIPADDPASDAAEMGRAEALRRSGKLDAAIEVIERLSKLRPDQPNIVISLGDILREQDRFEEASRAYDAGIAMFDAPDENQWAVYFARAITRERTDRWDEAEADFRKALELKPDQPQVLNYLGYSFVEQRKNLDEALDMIERAVAARPDSGYIADSLGWVFYRLGRYAEAVAPMEKAVELMPVDPVVNDHLGDVLWAVGRTREAQFQWKRALSFIDPKDTDGEADPDRIRRKLDVGLDAVLQEEGADPLKVANGG